MNDDKEPSGAQEAFGDFAPAFVYFTDDVLLGEVWPREDLSPKERSLVTYAGWPRAMSAMAVAKQVFSA
jgi:4-carboxymuconolactone decarboxylase